MNFCLESIGTKIFCDKPTKDNFELSNLVTNKGQGFVCESFVRPPIDIKLDFPIPVDISWIKLSTSVGERNSSSFTVFSKVGYAGSETKRKFNDGGEHHEPEMYCLGKWHSISATEVVLKNYNYKQCYAFPLPGMTHSENQFSGALRNLNKSSLNASTSIIIRITKVSPFGPPVLKQLEVWGQPSAILPLLKKKEIYNLWLKHRSNESSKSPLQTSFFSNMKAVETNENLVPPARRKIPAGVHIPEEFLDPFTCEIMTTPVLLPSGNSIDSSSLEKFVSCESSWGRSPCDPFTGIPFKENYKPEPNIYLKQRIDRFVLLEENLPSGSTSSGWTLENSYHRVSSNAEASRLHHPSKPKEEIREMVVNKSLKRPEKNFKVNLIEPKRAKPNTPPILPFKNTGVQKSGHALVQILGAAVSSSYKSKSQTSSRNGAAVNPNEENHSKFPTVSNDDDSYSLDQIAQNRLVCSCSCQKGPFYSLSCSHHLCSSCVKANVQVDDKLVRFILCDRCNSRTPNDKVFRIHPKSAFS